MKTETLIERTKDKWITEYNNIHNEWKIRTHLSELAIAYVPNKYRKSEVNQANAIFISKAVNNYDSLLSALKGAKDFLKYGSSDEAKELFLNDVEAVIKNAEK